MQPKAVRELKRALGEYADAERAVHAQRFFKTKEGEYGFGDEFIGVTMPSIRRVTKQFRTAPLATVEKLLQSKVHEERMLALIIMVEQYKRADAQGCETLYACYVRNLAQVNNWDLVDVTTPHIVGAHLYSRQKGEVKRTLQAWATSESLWERRVAMLATFYFIQQGKFTEALGVAQILRNDTHDLIHKAVGWMLREVGNRDRAVEERFLQKYYKTMPRTMLRYAIEKFPEPLRQQYLKSEV